MSGPKTNDNPPEVSAAAAETVEASLTDALTAIEAADDLESLKAARIAHAGEKSPLAHANRAIGALPPSAKADAGKRIGAARGRVSKALAAREEVLEELAEQQMLATERIDVTVVPRRRIGARHPLSLVADRISDIFVAMGWEIAEGPEVEAEWFNFDALNFDPDHPARAMQDTFFVEPPGSGLVLRTHTSPVQMRALHSRELPVYVAAPGKVFRTDDLDATHTPVFHQVEGLAVDKGLTMAHLRGTLDRLVSELVEAEVVTRLRPSFFPFTEPSAEMDVQCWICQGEDAGCRVCGGTGWIELGGCGMVNRNVLLAAGIDPQEYTGFAFGFGIERALMLRHGVADMFDIVEGDVRFSTQFGLEI